MQSRGVHGYQSMSPNMPLTCCFAIQASVAVREYPPALAPPLAPLGVAPTLRRCRSRREDWFGAPAAARYLGLYLTTLYRLINAGDLPAYQIGRVIRLRRVEVDAYIERSRVQPRDLHHLYPASHQGAARRAGSLDA